MLIKRGNAEIVSIMDASEILDEEAEKLTKAAKKNLKNNKEKQTKNSEKLEN